MFGIATQIRPLGDRTSSDVGDIAGNADVDRLTRAGRDDSVELPSTQDVICSAAQIGAEAAYPFQTATRRRSSWRRGSCDGTRKERARIRCRWDPAEKRSTENPSPPVLMLRLNV